MNTVYCIVHYLKQHDYIQIDVILTVLSSLRLNQETSDWNHKHYTLLSVLMCPVLHRPEMKLDFENQYLWPNHIVCSELKYKDFNLVKVIKDMKVKKGNTFF